MTVRKKRVEAVRIVRREIEKRELDIKERKERQTERADRQTERRTD